MSTIATLIGCLGFQREKTLATLQRIEKFPSPDKALAWRPGTDRAHVAWQLMHIAITEELFATERLMPEKSRAFEELWPRYRGGSTPDEQIPTLATIRTTLDQSRAHLLDTLQRFSESDLGTIPPAMAARGMTLHQVIQLIAWHEAHHQGQIHLTLNLYQAAHGLSS